MQPRNRIQKPPCMPQHPSRSSTRSAPKNSKTTREKILTLVREMRPRFVAAFERMQFQGHVIRIAVPSEALREEILRNKTELLLRIAETSGVQGMLELDVTINEEIRAARPIKLEDRVKYMTEKNPLLAELRRALDLEVE